MNAVIIKNTAEYIGTEKIFSMVSLKRKPKIPAGINAITIHKENLKFASFLLFFIKIPLKKALIILITSL
jgi:hypothetical protein